MEHPRNSLRALQDSSNRRSQVVNMHSSQAAENAYGGKNQDGSYGEKKGLSGHNLRNSLTNNNTSSQRQSRMMGKSYVNSAIEKAPTLDTIEQGMRNSGGARNLSLVAKASASVVNPGTYPSSTRD